MHSPATTDQHFQQAMQSLERTLLKLKGCSEEERKLLQQDLQDLQDMVAKLSSGQVDIVVFGEISTGKSALINALVGRSVADVDVQGGWTKEVWHTQWEGVGYCVPGLDQSSVVLVDTPGLNEVGGETRAQMAREAANRADLILFVTDSDLNETEHSALRELATTSKPIILVLNKIDLYTPAQRQRLLQVLAAERLPGIVPREQIVMTAADPREVEYVVESADGKTSSQWRSPPPQVDDLKAMILEVLDRDGLALITLNAAMYAADKSDRMAALRIRYRDKRANQTIWSYAVLKSAAVALNPVVFADVIGGGLVDATMVATLAKIYGLDLSWTHAGRLVASIARAAGWMVGGYMLGEAAIHLASTAFKALTFGYGTLLTAIPQGAAAGYGSYIVGQAAKYYFEHGASWGGQSPKAVVRRLLQETDKQSVLQQLKEEIKKKIQVNPHAQR